MFFQFLKYFVHYIFHAKTRQRLLYVAMIGLFISSFALIVLQSTMGGLQHNLMTRSKKISGDLVIHLKDKSTDFAHHIVDKLKLQKIIGHPEIELEMLLRVADYLAPVVVHGIEVDKNLPAFLQDHFFKDVLVPLDIAFRYGITPGDELKLISTTHVDTLFSDIPRMASALAGDTISTDVADIDSTHLWTRASLLQNLMRKREFNRIRIYGDVTEKQIEQVLSEELSKISIVSWERENNALVWALQLESTVMLSLFVAMTLLVSLSIISGLMIFYDKVKLDLSSFWILGAAKKYLEQSTFVFFNLMALISVLLGLALGLIFLFALDHYAFEIMPDIFVDRKIPIFISLKGILLSLAIPYFISLLFIYISVSQFDKDKSFLDHVRSVGN